MRGFNDRTAILLPSGKDSFHQPVNQSDLTLYQLPFDVNTLNTSAACMDAPCMCFICDTGIHNNGRFDSWNTARDAGTGSML